MYCEKNSKIRRDLLVWGFVLSVIAAIAVAGVGQSPAAAVADEGIEPVGVEVSGGDGDPVKPIQKIVFKTDMPIRDALRFLGTKYQKNIVPSAKVDGMVTAATLYDMTFESALNAILGHGYKYEERDDVIWVYTAEEFKKIMEDKDRMVYKVFTLYYISAAEAQKLITPVLSGAGTIQGSSPAELVVPTGESISAGTGGGDTMALNDTIVLLDYPENIVEVERLLKELDVRPRQVLIEATILSATLTEDMELGIDWNTIDGVAVTKTVTDGLMTDGLAGAVTGVTGLTVGITQDHLKVFIRALETITDTTILANPKILAINKQLGQVYIGTKIGYIDQTTQTQTSTTQSVKFLDTGTKLSFRPYIGNDGYIRMDIHPKDSSGTLKTNNIPDESSAELATNVIVKDGQTIVIGGLFRDVVVTTRNQVPLLGDLPLIGGLFRSTDDSTRRQEVIVLLTPHIIDEPEETNSDARIDDVRRKRFGAKDELQWIGRARLAEDRYAMAARYYIENDNESAMRELNVALELRPTYLEAERKDSERFLRR
ncbi:MAG: type II secretion system protein GspD [Planctomycetota bacterium]|jgi:type IV pilus assembly protein PilQ